MSAFARLGGHTDWLDVLLHSLGLPTSLSLAVVVKSDDGVFRLFTSVVGFVIIHALTSLTVDDCDLRGLTVFTMWMRSHGSGICGVTSFGGVGLGEPAEEQSGLTVCTMLSMSLTQLMSLKSIGSASVGAGEAVVVVALGAAFAE